jgi:hypothetical protein
MIDEDLSPSAAPLIRAFVWVYRCFVEDERAVFVEPSTSTVYTHVLGVLPLSSTMLSWYRTFVPRLRSECHR